VTAFTFGEPHSLRRYIEFGIIAGIIAGTLALVFDLSVPLVATLAAAVAAALGGHVRWLSRKRLPSSSEGAQDFPPIPIIAVVLIFLIGFSVSKCTGITFPTPGMQQQSAPIK